MFDYEHVAIPYADMAKMNRIRAWARKHHAIVDVQRYARDAYSGRVKIPFPWNKGRITVDAEIAEIKAIIEARRAS